VSNELTPRQTFTGKRRGVPIEIDARHHCHLRCLLASVLVVGKREAFLAEHWGDLFAFSSPTRSRFLFSLSRQINLEDSALSFLHRRRAEKNSWPRRARETYESFREILKLTTPARASQMQQTAAAHACCQGSCIFAQHFSSSQASVARRNWVRALKG
jgi:hypothetical protein